MKQNIVEVYDLGALNIPIFSSETLPPLNDHITILATPQKISWLRHCGDHLMIQALKIFNIHFYIIQWKLLKDHTLLIYEHQFHKNNNI